MHRGLEGGEIGFKSTCNREKQEFLVKGVVSRWKITERKHQGEGSSDPTGLLLRAAGDQV